MNLYAILSVLFFTLTVIGLWLLFEKAGRKGWIVLIPFYNFYVWLKIINKPVWWYIFLLIPFINVFVVLLMIVELLKCFNKHGIGEQALGVIFPFVYLPVLGFKKSLKYYDPRENTYPKKSQLREWVDAIIFAVIAATIIRTFLIEAYTIPTSSMEKSLLVGDFLFVSKISYGPKVPNTPIAFPFAHHTLPLTKQTKSYVEWIKLPYYRFPGLTTIKNNDVVVFNYPDGDTVALEMQNRSYYALVRERGWDFVNRNFTVTSRPVDKRENYIKRCIGIPGDTLEIINQDIYINNKLLAPPTLRQYNYLVRTNGSPINPRILQRYNITEGGPIQNPGEYVLTLTDEAANAVKKFTNVIAVQKIIKPKGYGEPYIFPFDTAYGWNEDNYGPLYIPKAGTTVELNLHNIILYERIINVYEDNDLEIKNGTIFINGDKATSYTFKMDYYWMMGDNRHNSADSRFWGFVPINHIVGKASFVWLSLDKEKSFPANIRWKKMFRIVK